MRGWKVRRRKSYTLSLSSENVEFLLATGRCPSRVVNLLLHNLWCLLTRESESSGSTETKKRFSG